MSAADPYGTLRRALEATERSKLNRRALVEAMRTGDVTPIQGFGGALPDSTVAPTSAVRQALGATSGAGGMGSPPPMYRPEVPVDAFRAQRAAAQAAPVPDAARRGIMGQLSGLGGKGLAGVIQRKAAEAGAREGAGRLAQFAGRNPALLARGVAGPLSLVGGAAASLAADQINVGGEDSNWDKFTTGAAGGAVGGAVFGPKGALIGGLIGGAGNVLLSELGILSDEAGPDQTVDDQVDNLMSAAMGMVEPDAINMIRDRFEMRNTFGQLQEPDRSPDEIRQENYALMVEEMRNAADAEMIAQQEQAALEAQPGYMTPEETAISNAYMQAVMGAYIKPFADEMLASGNASAASLEQLAGSSGNLAPILRNQAQLERANSARMAGGLMQSAMAEPWLQAARTQQSQIAQQSQSIIAQAMAMVNSGGVGMGGTPTAAGGVNLADFGL